MKTRKPAGRLSGETREELLKATEKVMVKEGYAAVSTRRIAKEIGVTPALVHYYFATTDQLLLETLRRKNDLHEKKVAEALASEKPLSALWNFYRDTSRTALSIEFMSMVNHRKAIRKELSKDIEKSRRIQAEGIEKLLTARKFEKDTFHPLAIAMLVSAMGRTFVMEKALGVSCAHPETLQLIEGLIEKLEGPQTSK